MAGVPLVAGLSVGVAQEGKPVFLRGYRKAALEADVPMADTTILRTGSLTETFTATLVLRLVAQGRLAVADDSQTYLPEAPTHGQRVTVQHLLNHTSGFPSCTNRPDDPWQRAEARSHAKMLARIAGDSLNCAPGKAFRYTNSGYYLLGLLIEGRTGRSCAEALQGHLLNPIGLPQTQYCPDVPASLAHARGIAHRRSLARCSALVPSACPSRSLRAPCARPLPICCLDDGTAVGRGPLRHPVRGDAYPHDHRSRDTVGYGYGPQRTERFGYPFVGHGGGINGFATQWGHVPAQELTLLVMANTEEPAAPAPVRMTSAPLASVCFHARAPSGPSVKTSRRSGC